MQEIKGYEGLYSITRDGRVWSHKRKVKNGNGFRTVNGKWLTPSIKENGYLIIGLWENNKGKSYYLHRLIAMAFISNPKNKLFINHIDGNKLNNDISNLEWCTFQENMIHAVKNGLTIKGENAWNSKLTEKEVIIIRKMASKGITQRKIAKEFNIAFQTISKVVRKEIWIHI